MPNSTRFGRGTSGYDYPPANPGPEPHDPYTSDENTSLEDWTASDIQPLTQQDRPGITPEALTVVNHIRAQRGQRSRTRARASQQRPSDHQIPAPSRGAHAPSTQPLPARARSRMRRVLRSLREPNHSWDDPAASTGAHQRSSSRHHQHPTGRSRHHRYRGYRSQRSQDPYMAELHEQGQRLAQQNEDVSTSIAAMPSYRASGQGRRQRSTSDDGDAENSRRKRRRVGATDSSLQKRSRIRYGFEGQVNPGRLDMELLSADGGAYEPSSARFHGGYSVENILQDDGRVYCTQGSASNIVLCHKEETAFTVDRLVIKAPAEGFTNPVEEGLVFLATDLDSTFELTSKYKIHYWPKCYFAKFYPDYKPTRSRRHRRHAITLDEAWPALQPMRTGPVARATAVQDPEDAPDPAGCLDASDSDASSVTLTDEESDGDSYGSSSETEQPAEETVATATTGEDLINAYEFLREQRLQGRRGAGQDLHTLIARGEQAQAARGPRPAHAHESGPQPEPQTPLPDFYPTDWRHPNRERTTAASVEEGKIYEPDFTLLVPAARFSMGHHRRKKRRGQDNSAHVMTVKFDPPISGRYLLLKLWNPQQEKNIDIQNVSVFGYAGPRWYPAIETC